MQSGSWTIRHVSWDDVRALVSELGVSEITAAVLVRRGYADPAAARAFLAGEQPGHDPMLLGDTAAAVERILAAVAAGEKICVHGDYDVDGICATALAVLCCASSAPTSGGTCRAGSRRGTVSRATRSCDSPAEGCRWW